MDNLDFDVFSDSPQLPSFSSESEAYAQLAPNTLGFSPENMEPVYGFGRSPSSDCHLSDLSIVTGPQLLHSPRSNTLASLPQSTVSSPESSSCFLEGLYDSDAVQRGFYNADTPASFSGDSGSNGSQLTSSYIPYFTTSSISTQTLAGFASMRNHLSPADDGSSIDMEGLFSTSQPSQVNWLKTLPTQQLSANFENSHPFRTIRRASSTNDIPTVRGHGNSLSPNMAENSPFCSISPTLSEPGLPSFRNAEAGTNAGQEAFTKGPGFDQDMTLSASPDYSASSETSADEMSSSANAKKSRSFPCVHAGCGKAFNRAEHLNRHIRSVHTLERPYVCPHPSCPYRFARADNLTQHMRVHRPPMSGKRKTSFREASERCKRAASPFLSTYQLSI